MNNYFTIQIKKNNIINYIRGFDTQMIPMLTQNYDNAETFDFLEACEKRNMLNEKRRYKYNNFYIEKVGL